MGLFRRKTKAIQAYQYRVDTTPNWDNPFFENNSARATMRAGDYGIVNTPHGTTRVNKGDFIILGLDGNRYVLPAKRFLQDFEEVVQVDKKLDTKEKLWDNICDNVDREVKQHD